MVARSFAGQVATSTVRGSAGFPTLGQIVASQGEIVGSGPGEQDVARAVVTQAHQLLGVTVALAQIEADHLHVVACAGSRVIGLEGLWFERSGSLSQACLEAGRPLVSAEVTEDRRVTPFVGSDLDVRSMAVAPLRPGGTDLGVLMALAAEPGAFDQEVGDVLSLLGLAADSALAAVAARSDLAREKLRLSATSMLTGTGLWRWDVRTGEVHWSPEMFEITGLDPATTVPTLELWESRLHPEDRHGAQRMRSTDEAADGVTEALRLRHTDGTWRELLAWSRMLREDGQAVTVFGATIDVTGQRTAEREVARMSARDGLTGLANRGVLDDLTRRAIAALSAAEEPSGPPGANDVVPNDVAIRPTTALLLLDLDRFKLINDTMGHAVGDALLVETARRLTSALELTAITDCAPTIARLGGDEFVVLLPWVADAEAACDVARWLLDEVRRPIDVAGSSAVVCTGSIGVAATSDSAHTASELFREADLAMYRAKENGRDRVAMFDVHMKAQAETRVRAERTLRSALARDRLLAVYQPIVSLADQSVVGVEALVRMLDDDGALVPPDSFISVAEDTGLIVELDRWMLGQAVTALGRWQHRGVGPLGVQVNVSARTLSQPGFDGFVVDLLHQHTIDHSELRLELTETSLVPGGSAAQDTMRRLAAVGIKTGVDDFGTGYSSLAYLQDLPVAFIKVDRTFVSRLDGSPRPSAVVRAVIELAHAHGYQVTAEGVETQQQADLLREMSCDHAQGWLFGRPSLGQVFGAEPATDVDPDHHW
jgi:diguanylate cyclase (GGDEF)-like protein